MFRFLRSEKIGGQKSFKLKQLVGKKIKKDVSWKLRKEDLEEKIVKMAGIISPWNEQLAPKKIWPYAPLKGEQSHKKIHKHMF